MDDYLYLPSSLISVFPSTKRSITQPSSRQMTEENIAAIINKLIDMDGFVITNYKSEENPFEFNIYGYHFVVTKAKDIQDLFPSATSIYAHITISKTGNFYELDGQDDTTDGEYKGVELSNSEPSGTGVHFLKLFEREDPDSPWYVPIASMIKLTNVFAKGVDGGVI